MIIYKINSTIILNLLISLTVCASEAPDFDNSTRIFTFPRITENKTTVYRNTQIMLDQDSTWELLTFEKEIVPNLTGDWEGILTIDNATDFGPTLTCPAKIELSLIQDKNNLSGTGLVYGDCSEIDETIAGSITGNIIKNKVTFDILSRNQTFSFSGTVSKPHDLITLRGPAENGDKAQKEWLLTLPSVRNDPNFDSITRIMTIPLATSDQSNLFRNIQVLFDLDNTWKTLTFEEENEPNITGDWSGDLIVAFSIFSPVPICNMSTEISFIQNGDVLTGTVTEGCYLQQKKSITGVVTGNNISFDIISDFSSDGVFHYTGSLSITHDSLTLIGPIDIIGAQGAKGKLSLH